ncbi:FAD-binding protein [Deltaproteobacteria bacterium OttesenSCG-928-M10]|nr:FAD-binding protein [Deltaproteobacteria bacterium OttesenSCG-928-M10]
MLSMNLINEFKAVVGPENCRYHAIDLDLYSYDSSPFVYQPDLLLFPRTAEEISKIVKLAAMHGVPVTPRGAGTSLSGGAVAKAGGVMIITTRMDKVLELDLLEETVLVEPGLVNLELQNYLKPHGYMFPPDPASQQASTLGGNIAVNSGGLKCLKYGVTKHYVKGLEMVLNDGRIVRTGHLALADEDGGPDPSGIFLSSEGTMGVITKALLRITPLPADTIAVSAVFDSQEKSGRAVSSIIAAGILPAKMEFIDNLLIVAVEDYLHLGFPRDAEAILLIEVDGQGPELPRQMEDIAELCRKAGALSIQTAQTPEEQDLLWVARRAAGGVLGRIKPAYLPHDIAAPVSKLGTLLTTVAEIGRKHGLLIAKSGHVGDGNIHPELLYDPNDPEETERAKRVFTEVGLAVLPLGGTITGEHGVGLEKIEFMVHEFTPDELEFMSQIKKTFDGRGLMNPGKILPEEYLPSLTGERK